MKFLEAISNVFRVPDLRKRLLFALGLLAVYRLGGHIPTPGIDTNRLEDFFRQNSVPCLASSICSAAGRFAG